MGGGIWNYDRSPTMNSSPCTKTSQLFAIAPPRASMKSDEYLTTSIVI